MPTQEDVLVRHATREDVPVILQLIRELADYEKELSAVEATEESLLATLSFAASPATPEQGKGILQGQVLEPISPQRAARTLLLFPPRNSEQGTAAAAPPAAVGMALYYHTYSTWRSKPGIYLEDLYVQPAQRGKGYGKRLIEELAKLVVAIEGGRLEWSVLSWNKPSIDFYEKVIGASEKSGWLGMRVDGEALGKLAAGGGGSGSGDRKEHS